MIDTSAFTKLVPGFDFLQNLMQNAGQAVPPMGQWVAPTLNPEELDKRIGELKTVQFWLEQNARMIGATIQALEVQRMTLSTLQTMNLPMADLHSALTLPTTPPAQPPAPRKPAITARRSRPEAMVGRADPAVHRTGHEGDGRQPRHRRARHRHGHQTASRSAQGRSQEEACRQGGAQAHLTRA
jgi:hypothetical protein